MLLPCEADYQRQRRNNHRGDQEAAGAEGPVVGMLGDGQPHQHKHEDQRWHCDCRGEDYSLTIPRLGWPQWLPDHCEQAEASSDQDKSWRSGSLYAVTQNDADASRDDRNEESNAGHSSGSFHPGMLGPKEAYCRRMGHSTMWAALIYQIWYWFGP